MFNRTLSVLVAGAFAAVVGSLAATSATAADPRMTAPFCTSAAVIIITMSIEANTTTTMT